MTKPFNFLESGALGRLFAKPAAPRKSNSEYGRLYRWCKRNGITMPVRDLSYYDFDDDRIGTIGSNDGAQDRFVNVLEIAQKRIATGKPEATLWD